MAGTPSAAFDSGRESAWYEPPTVDLKLRPISRANRGEHGQEDPVIDNRVVAQKLVAQYEKRLQQERKRFARLFAAPLLDIGTLTRLTVEERTILLAVIDGCLSNPNRQYRTPDGSTIALLNPDEPTYTLLRASDGVLLLPRYRLQREEMEPIPVWSKTLL